MVGERRQCRSYRDAVTAPRFVPVSRAKGAEGVLQIALDVPSGMSRQYFDAVIAESNGRAENEQLGEDGLSSPFTSDNAPTSVRMVLPVFEVIGEPVKVMIPLSSSADAGAYHSRGKREDTGFWGSHGRPKLAL